MDPDSHLLVFVLAASRAARLGLNLMSVTVTARANNIQSFRCKARPLRPRKRPQRSISRTFYANNRRLRRPGPWQGAGRCPFSAGVIVVLARSPGCPSRNEPARSAGISNPCRQRSQGTSTEWLVCPAVSVVRVDTSRLGLAVAGIISNSCRQRSQ